jgi:hypothetical protein
VLALEDDRDLPVRLLEILGRVRVEIQGVDAPADAAVAQRRVEARGHGLDGLRPGIHHRDDDAVGPVVEGPLDVVVPAGRDTRQGDTPRVRDGPEHGRRRFHPHLVVLDVYSEVGKPGPGQEPGGRDVAERQPGPDHRLAVFQVSFDCVRSHGQLPGGLASRNAPLPSDSRRIQQGKELVRTQDFGDPK